MGLESPLGAQSLPAASSDPHNNPEWPEIAAHLPDLQSAGADRLEIAADVLRARHFQEDALTYYRAAMARGGDPAPLLKKMGIVCLEMQQAAVARAYFQRAVRVNKKDSGAWNNLGAADFLLSNNSGAVHDYRKAIKLHKQVAVYHSNLALVYFSMRDAEGGRAELSRALALDPNLLRRDSQGGDTARVLAATSYSEICFEMARIYAAQGNLDAMLDWLTKASERGYNVRDAMDADSVLRPMLADPRVKVLLKNEEVLRASSKTLVKVPSLGAAQSR